MKNGGLIPKWFEYGAMDRYFMGESADPYWKESKRVAVITITAWGTLDNAAPCRKTPLTKLTAANPSILWYCKGYDTQSFLSLFGLETRHAY
jgi:hypothetical protein